MKAELRIGNYVKHGLSSFQDGRYRIPDGKTIDLIGDTAIGIELSEEWLKRFGAFRKKGDAWWTLNLPDKKDLGATSTLRYSKGFVFIEQLLHQGFTYSKAAEIIAELEKKDGPIDDDKFGIALRKNSVQIETSINFVHELQNLYWVLTNTELTLKETVK